ncbi:hypothetical protein KX729_27390 [Rhizobium sp. XQZ8]|uniref:hypothetical protein n=1 Tax=Rhizobium populisoli TaxID=2859785 RepID=UPI001CA51DCB|nr:hypothetical protein [Rhizobium populisoli]MBW6425170.1 hypothetical protein [Rhizobium populisoli]
MTEFIDLADEKERASISEEYVAATAEYRRRLALLRDNLPPNGLVEQRESLSDQASQVHH